MPSHRPLTILHVAAPAPAGGLESVVVDLVGGLTALGHRVAFAALLGKNEAEHPVPSRAAAGGAEVNRIVVPPRAYRTEFRALRALIANLRPDVVHTHGYHADLIGGLAATRAGVPWVATVHGFVGGGLKNRFYEWLQVRAYRRADAVIAVSIPIRDRLVRSSVPAAQVRLLANARAVRPLLSREEARRRLGLGGRDAVIGWVGRFTHEKGADVFLEALALLPDRSWRAAVIGDGNDRSVLEALARTLGVADRVNWHGMVADAADLYPAFDVWVLSSRTEGTPIALLEAMAARVPIVATAVGGVPDVVTSAEALLVPGERPEELAQALSAALSDSEGAAARAEAAYRRSATAFSPGEWLDAHVALYRRISRAGGA